ncbi:LLM class flavin-dependent oxidoreductase [Flavobacterium aquidurense]|uniref:LLM class flavin-dependent oxidoreductase n=1 Tax=Flavobacterium aquidurense TaxID=362413 RepID=UPI0037208203
MENNNVTSSKLTNSPTLKIIEKPTKLQFPISILDVATTGKGYTANQAIENSLQIAKLADQRGFKRYWVAEHHSMPAVSTSSPAMLLSRLIGETKQIRLGSGGMMLTNFPPLVIAEQFGMLQAMAPNRIDLGIGRAPGTNGRTAAALQRNMSGAELFPEQLEELIYFLNDSFPLDHPYRDKVFAVPGPGQDKHNDVKQLVGKPDLWLLGSSDYSARLAGKRGLSFAFAAQLAPENMVFALDAYRENFIPSESLDKPYVMVCFSVFAASTEKEAEIQSRSFAHSMLLMMSGKPYIIPSPEEIKNYPYTASELSILENWQKKMIYGTPETVANRLNELQKISNADEIMIANLGHSQEGIFNSASLIADAFNMPHLNH